MKKYFCIINLFILMNLGSIILFNTGCGKKENLPQPQQISPQQIKSQPVTTPKKIEPPKYEYRGDQYRDPFIALTGGLSSNLITDEVVVPNMNVLTLKGIMNDGKNKYAIISGGDITYMLIGNKLYDNKHRLVRGFIGIIKKESVLMIAPDRSTKELRLRTKK